MLHTYMLKIYILPSCFYYCLATTLSPLGDSKTLPMFPLYREQLIAGVVVGCIALGLLLSALIFSLVRYCQRSKRVRIEDDLPRTTLKRKPSLGPYL
jgi:type III secretory pathway component EscU